VTREVKLRFDEEGISIPFPQRDVHIYEEQLGERNGAGQREKAENPKAAPASAPAGDAVGSRASVDEQEGEADDV
jgi:small-conductance mechanosensitive channel